MGHTANYIPNQAPLIALSASQAGIGVLSDMQERLALACDELKRMEYESGIPLDEAQAAKADAYFKASARVNNLLLFKQSVLYRDFMKAPVFRKRMEDNYAQ